MIPRWVFLVLGFFDLLLGVRNLAVGPTTALWLILDIALLVLGVMCVLTGSSPIQVREE